LEQDYRGSIRQKYLHTTLYRQSTYDPVVKYNMQKNVGGYDRLARLVLGPILLIGAAAASGGYVTLASGFVGAAIIWVALLVGVVLLVTGVVQVCPLNRVLGIDTLNKATGDSSSEEPIAESDEGPGRPA
jgi:hypothetical protein